MSSSYPGRPGASPVVAALFAAGVIHSEHAVLDVGCGRGTDVVALARWGVRSVCGIDIVLRDLRLAEAKARRHRVARRTAFHLGSITEQHICFEPGQFNVVIDSLCWNNLDDEDDLPYARELHRILARDGHLVLQARMRVRPIGPVPRLPRTLERFFDLGPRVVTHLPERGTDREREWATVVVAIGQRRHRVR